MVVTQAVSGKGKHQLVTIPTECLPYLPICVLQRAARRVGFHGLPFPAGVSTSLLLVMKSVARFVSANCEVGSSEESAML